MSFAQGNPSVPTLINSSNTLVYGNTSTGTALSVQQLGSGAVASFSNAAGTSMLSVTSGQSFIANVQTATGGFSAFVQGNILPAKDPASGYDASYDDSAQFTVKSFSGIGTYSVGNLRMGVSSNTTTTPFGYTYLQGINTFISNMPISLQPRGGNVGIGTASPGNLFQVGAPTGPIYTNNPLSQSNVIIFGNSPSTPTYAGTGTMGGTLFVNSTNAFASNVGASIALGGRGQDFGGGQQHMTFARIQGTQAVTNGAYYGNFVIETQNSGALYERLRIDQNGYVGIGTTSPGFTLDVNGAIHGTSTFVGSSGTTNASWAFNYVDGSTYKSLIFGNVNSTNNSGEFSYNHVGAGSTSNYVGLGFYGNTNKFVVQASGNVGIGTTSPAYTLDVNTSSTTVFRIQSSNSPAGMNISCYNDTTKDCGIQNNNGQLNFLASSTPGTPYFNFYTGASGVYTTKLGGFSAALTGGATTLSVDANGYIIRTPSDQKLKSNIQTIPYGLDTVNSLRPVSYEWKDPGTYGSGRQIGLIAQEAQQVVPECVSGSETLSLDYQKLVPVLTKAIQELSAQVASLEQSLSSAVANISSLEARLALLEAK